MARQGKVEAYEYIADADLAAAGGLVKGPKTKINIENLATGAVPDASTTVKGKVELATNAETVTGTDTVRATTPAGVAAAIANNRGVLEYVALLTQTGTDAPVATVLRNTLGGAVVWTYVGAGNYRATLAGAFPSGKTVLIATGNEIGGGNFNLPLLNREGNDSILLWTVQADAGALSDALLSGTAIVIQVYP
ncbi:MAG: hypothetical protein V9G98_22400 [Candidatus Competibacter sp.]